MKKYEGIIGPGPGPNGEHFTVDMPAQYCVKHCSSWLGDRRTTSGRCAQEMWESKRDEQGRTLCGWTHEKKTEKIKSEK